MKIKKTLICVLVLSIITTFLVLSCVISAAAVDPDISSVDLNNDGAINMADVMILATAFNSSSGDSRYIERLDLQSDGAVNFPKSNRLW